MTPAAPETVADRTVALLRSHGIDTVFGIPGLHTLPLWDALHRRSDLRVVVTRHEQAAAMAADGYARASGRPAAVVAITGPGATNTLTGVATAWADSVPMVVVTGHVASRHVGRDMGTTHELLDQRALFRGVTNASTTVTHAAQIDDAVAQTLVELGSARPRPVHLEIPYDVQTAAAPPRRPPSATPTPAAASGAALARAAEILRAARRPLVYCGGGAQNAAAEIEALAEHLGAAVLTTPAGRGVVPDDHPLALGCAWTKATRDGPLGGFLAECDAMLALGVSFGGNPTGDWSLPVPAALIQIDLDPAVLGRHYPAAEAVQARVEDAVPALQAWLADPGERDPRYAAQVREHEQALQARCPAESRALLDAIRRGVGRDGVVVCDVTVIAYTATTYLPVHAPRSYLSPAKFGTLGFGLPAAIGAKIARPDRNVVAICGDGGVMLNLHELATAAQERLALPIVVHNNAGYGAIRHSQDVRFGGRRIGTELHTPDFGTLAKAFAIAYCRPEDPSHLAEAIADACSLDTPTLIEWTEPLPFPW